MQQTETYKLNKPETSDNFTPAPLNENADKIEAELARVDASAAALAQRVVSLENCRIVLGKYVGTGSSSRIIDLGERPLAVIVCGWSVENSHMGLAVADAVLQGENVTQKFYLTDNGFHVVSKQNGYGDEYCFVAFLGGWDTMDIPKSGT